MCGGPEGGMCGGGGRQGQVDSEEQPDSDGPSGMPPLWSLSSQKYRHEGLDYRVGNGGSCPRRPSL